MDDGSEPLSALAAIAVMHHELYTAYVEAGFAPAQALTLLIAHIQPQATTGGNDA